MQIYDARTHINTQCCVHICLQTHTFAHKRYLNTQQPVTKKPKITGTCRSNHNVYNEAKLERFLGNGLFKQNRRSSIENNLNNAAIWVARKHLTPVHKNIPTLLFYFSQMKPCNLTNVWQKCDSQDSLGVRGHEETTLTIRQQSMLSAFLQWQMRSIPAVALSTDCWMS